MNEQIQVPKELLESLLNSVNGDFYMGKEWEESTVAQLRKHITALSQANVNEQSQAQQLSGNSVQLESQAQQEPLKVSENWREPLSADAMQRLKSLGLLDKSPAPEGE